MAQLTNMRVFGGIQANALVPGCAISPDGTLVATGSHDHLLRIIEIATGKPLLTYPHSSPISGLVWGKDGPLAVGLDGNIIQASLIGNTWTAAVLHSLNAQVNGCAVAGNGTLAVAYNVRNQVAIISAHGQNPPQYINVPAKPHRLAFSPSGNLLAVGCDRSVLQVLKADVGWAPALTVALPARGVMDRVVWSIAFSPDGTRLLVGTLNTVHVFAVPKQHDAWVQQQPIGMFDGHSSATAGVHGIGFLPEKNLVVTGASDQRLLFWSLQDCTTKREVSNVGMVGSLSIYLPSSDDGQGQLGLLAAGITGVGFKLWEIAAPVNPNMHARMADHQRSIRDARAQLDKLAEYSEVAKEEAALVDDIAKLEAKLAKLTAKLQKQQAALRKLQQPSTAAQVEKYRTYEQKRLQAESAIQQLQAVLDTYTAKVASSGLRELTREEFGQWLVDVGLEHVVEQMERLSPQDIISKTFAELSSQFSFVDLSELLIRATITHFKKSTPPSFDLPRGFLSMTKSQVRKWLIDTDPRFEVLAAQEWTGPCLLYANATALENASEHALTNADFLKFKSAVSKLRNEDGSPDWVKRLNGAVAVVDQTCD